MKLLLTILLSLTAAMASVEAKEVLVETDHMIIWVGTPDEMVEFIKEYVNPDSDVVVAELQDSVFANAIDHENERFVYFVNDHMKASFLETLAIHFCLVERQRDELGMAVQQMRQLQMENMALQMQLQVLKAQLEPAETP